MSEHFFDELARTLASPMPRRRALRLTAVGLLAATVPGIRPPRAAARLHDGTPCESLCHSQDDTPHPLKPCGVTGKNVYGETNCYNAGCYDPTVDKCCRIGQHTDTWPGVYVCPKDSRCGTVDSIKAGGSACVADCSPCGNDCCASDEFCASPKRSLCCKKGDDACLVPEGAGGTCCKPGTVCKFDKQHAVCCRPNQVLRKGTCACRDPKQQPCGNDCCDTKRGEVCTNKTCCKKGETGCGGNACCKKGDTCSNGTCCPKGQVDCAGDGKCCAKLDCCGKTCCKDDAICAHGTCCPPARGFGSGKNARCCPAGTVPVKGGPTGTSCCPPGDPTCCSGDDNLAPVCKRGSTCVAGSCVAL